MTSERCAECRDLAPELALGIADGEDRARALGHLNTCAECRRYLDELSATADELLALAPEREPPLGFEDRVLAAVTPAPRPKRRRWWRPVPMAATATVAAGLAALAMVFVYRNDHRLAGQYRSTLSEAHGSYFTASALRAPSGDTVGQLFAYQGKPSWVMVTVRGAQGATPSGNYVCQVVTADGQRHTVGWVRIHKGSGSYGSAIRVPLEHISEVRLLGPGKGSVLEAQLTD